MHGRRKGDAPPSWKSAVIRTLFTLAVGGLLASVVIALTLPVDEPLNLPVMWSEVQKVVAASSSKVDSIDESGAGTCTAFSINEDRGFYLTAFHCLGTSMWVDGQIAWVVYQNENHDLLVIDAPGARKPALKPSATGAIAGMAAGAYGYGEGWPVAQLRVGLIAGIGLPLSEVTQNRPSLDNVLMFDQGFVGGMSGGPIVDSHAGVIGIVQLGDVGATLGLGRQIDLILHETGQFWEK